MKFLKKIIKEAIIEALSIHDRQKAIDEKSKLLEKREELLNEKIAALGTSCVVDKYVGTSGEAFTYE